MDFLQLSGKTVLVTGIANRKSVAWHTASLLKAAGAQLVLSVRSEARAHRCESCFRTSRFTCVIFRSSRRLIRCVMRWQHWFPVVHGLVHSVAFADYSAGWLPFHQTPRSAFLQAVDISCFSLIALSNAFREQLDPHTGSVVTISISTTRMAAENYGYMAPVKAALDSSLCFLAKSFSQFSRVRFNAVCPGLLKTSASAGIPGYVDSYLFAEKATLRKQAVQTEEVAAAVAFC